MEIIEYKEKYFKDLDDLQKSVWGEGSDTDEIFENIENYKIMLAIENEELIGASVSHEQNKSTYFADFIIIKPNSQCKGIGSKLMEKIIEFAKSQNYKEIICEAIGVYGKINSQKMLENFGFEVTGFYENYWGKKCPDFFCTQCGKKPCECSMMGYRKILD